MKGGAIVDWLSVQAHLRCSRALIPGRPPRCCHGTPARDSELAAAVRTLARFARLLWFAFGLRTPRSKDENERPPVVGRARAS